MLILSAINWIQIRSGHCVRLLHPRVNRGDVDTGLDVLKLGDTRLNLALAVASSLMFSTHVDE